MPFKNNQKGPASQVALQQAPKCQGPKGSSQYGPPYSGPYNGTDYGQNNHNPPYNNYRGQRRPFYDNEFQRGGFSIGGFNRT